MESQHPIMVLNDQYRLRTRLISIESQPKKIVVVVVIGVVGYFWFCKVRLVKLVRLDK